MSGLSEPVCQGDLGPLRVGTLEVEPDDRLDVIGVPLEWVSLPRRFCKPSFRELRTSSGHSSTCSVRRRRSREECASCRKSWDLSWWEHQKRLKDGMRRPCRFYPRLMTEERDFDRAAGGPWRHGVRLHNSKQRGKPESPSGLTIKSYHGHRMNSLHLKGDAVGT